MNEVSTYTAEQTADKDIQLVNNGIQLFQSVPELLKGSKNSVMNANHFTNKFLAKVQANGGKLNEDLDKEAEQLIVKLKATGVKMNESRSPVTQIFTAITKMFTGQEAEIKTIAESIQPLRNDWAKWLIAETERKQREAAARAAIETAKAELAGAIIAKIGLILNGILFKKKEGWTASFNTITLDNFSVKEAGLKGLKTSISKIDIDTQLVYELPYSKLDAATQQEVKVSTHAEYDFTTWMEKAAMELAEYKQQLIDRLPSKRSELEEAAEAERKRKADEERRRIENEQRQAEINKAEGEKRRQLEEQQRLQKIEDDKRQAALAEEQKRLEADRLERERLERERLDQEKRDNDRKAQEAADLAITAGTAKTLFDQVIEATPDTAAPDARTGYEITVLNHAGFAQIFEFWYRNKAIAMNIDDCLKTTIKQMKAFAEAQAKDGNRIESKFLRYDKTVKAVNKKS